MSKFLKCCTLFLFFLSIFTFTSCSYKITNEENAIFEENDQYNFEKPITSSLSMASSDNTYYFLGGPDNHYLYSINKKSMETKLLCDKKGCLHFNETDPNKIDSCNAFFLSCSNLIFYKSNLYAFADYENSKAENQYSLLQISLDGLTRKELFKFVNPPERMIIHRGFLYFSCKVGSKENSKENEVYLYRIDLSNLSNIPEMIFMKKGFSNAIGSIIGYGDYVYFGYFGYTSKDEPQSSIMQYNISTAKIKELSKAVGRFVICGNHIIYYNLNDATVYKCDLLGENNVELKNIKNGYMYSDSRYIIVDSIISKIRDNAKRELLIYDINGTLLQTTSIDNIGTEPIYGSDSDCIFIQSNRSQSNEFGDIKTLSIINKADIINGVANIKPIYTFIPRKKFPVIILND